MFDKYIQFKREREIGETLSDTFKFIRENIKPLFKILTKTAGVPFIILVFAITYYSYTTGKQSFDLMSILNDSQQVSDGILDFYFSIFLGAIIMLIASAVFYAFLVSTIHYSVKSYMKNEGTILTEEVSLDVKQNWLNYLGMSFIIGILTFIGIMLCFLPGIYIGVVLTLMYSIYAFNNLSIGESFSYSFQLIKSNWWMSFFAMLITYILVYILSLIFQLPAIIYMFVKGFAISQEGSLSDPSSMFDWGYVILTAISSIGQYLFYIIFIVACIFIYFNLNEKKNQTGMYDEINSLGNR